MKNVLMKLKKEKTMVGAALVAGMSNLPIFAQASSYTAPLNNLKTILITVSESVGAVILIFGIMRFAYSFTKYDQAGEHQSVFIIVAGGLLVGIGAVLQIMGV